MAILMAMAKWNNVHSSGIIHSSENINAIVDFLYLIKSLYDPTVVGKLEVLQMALT